jgi:predicted RND superfamily exporter protein
MFVLVSLLMIAGIFWGPSGHNRPAFTLKGDPIWEAGERAELLMPSEGRDVPLFVGPKEQDGQVNVLALPVLRELVRRHDAVMSDEKIRRHFVSYHHWMVQAEVRGPWGMAETVRSIMNGDSPVSAQIHWFGPNFEAATDDDLNEVLTRLFEIETEDGHKPYRTFLSGLKRQANGSWQASAFYILGIGDSDSLYGPNGEYSKAPGGEKPFFEIWERSIDEIYAEPMTDTGQMVHVWSFLGLDSEVTDEVNQTLPLVGISFVLMVVVLGLFFKDWRDLVSASAGLGLLMLWMFGTQAWLGYPRTQISSMLPILLLALGVDFSFHGLYRWRKLAVEAGISEIARLLAAWDSIRALRPALGLATVTTMIAFGAAAFSSIQDLAEWGRLAVIYIFEGYLLLGVFTVVLRSGMSVKARDPHGKFSKNWGTFGVFQVRHPRRFLCFFLIITGAAWAIGQPDTDFDVHDYLDSNSRMVRSIDIANALFDESNKGEPGIVLVEATDKSDLANLQTLLALDQLMADFRSNDWSYGEPTIIDLLRWQVTSTLGGASGFRPTQIDPETSIPTDAAELRMMLRDIARNGAVDPTNPRAFASARDVTAIARIDPETGRLSMLSLPIKVEKAEDWMWMKEFKTQLEGTIDKHLGAQNDLKATLTGISFQRFVYVNAMTDSFKESIYWAISACLIVLFVVLRDIRLSILTITPVIAVAFWLNAGMNIFGASLNLVTLQVASLAIGLGLDFAIHVTQGIREQRLRSPGKGLEAWVSAMMSHTGMALFASGITDILGFSVLMLSIMPMFTMFSKVMIAMVILALAACLFCLPALLALFGGLSQLPDSDGNVNS